jgi:hypothetical protein
MVSVIAPFDGHTTELSCGHRLCRPRIRPIGCIKCLRLPISGPLPFNTSRSTKPKLCHIHDDCRAYPSMAAECFAVSGGFRPCLADQIHAHLEETLGPIPSGVRIHQLREQLESHGVYEATIALTETEIRQAIIGQLSVRGIVHADVWASIKRDGDHLHVTAQVNESIPYDLQATIFFSVEKTNVE